MANQTENSRLAIATIGKAKRRPLCIAYKATLALARIKIGGKKFARAAKLAQQAEAVKRLETIKAASFFIVGIGRVKPARFYLLYGNNAR